LRRTRGAMGFQRQWGLAIRVGGAPGNEKVAIEIIDGAASRGGGALPTRQLRGDADTDAPACRSTSSGRC